jgi:anaerobic ribonucleoside-triphosphate reductase activating protein
MNHLALDISIHAVEYNSLSNGPGNRMVLWVQGCTLNCPGCFNPETHQPNRENLTKITALLHEIKKHQKNIEGITISGGEPLQQLPAIIALCQLIKQQTALGIIVLTGYAYSEIQTFPLFQPLISSIDLMIAGRFNQHQLLKYGLRGSTNKTYHFFTKRYNQTLLENTKTSEIIIKPGGEIVITGIDPLVWETNES